MDTEVPPFRYDARLANEIEQSWQDRWEREGTFHAPNPSGALSGDFTRVARQRKFYLVDFSLIPAASDCMSVIRWVISARTCSAAICG
jgi:leucyl-tRNA synthetase